ncbi:MAG: hypothetical protein K2K13_04750 [Clostridiales bacterium]|nr:hypothetical protein [Clostridiales bacterium]
MKKRDKILEFLLKPPVWVCIVVWVLGAGTLSGSIALYFLGLGLKLWALPVHLCALVFFILSVYAVLTVIGLPHRAKTSVHVQRFFASYNVRAFVYAAGSVIFNICYVVFGIIIANLEQSPWLAVLVGYHVFLIVPRATVFLIKRRDGDRAVQNVRAYAYCGLALMLLALALVPVIRLVLDDRNTYNFFISGIIYVTAIATYTFVKLGIAIHNLRKVRKSDDMPLKAIKNVSFADALISIFALQAMMIKTFPSDGSNIAIMNPVLGGVVSLGIFALGLYMLISGRKQLKALPPENAKQATDTAETDKQNADMN